MSTSSVIYPGFESAISNDALKGKLLYTQVTSEASGQTGAMNFQKDAQTPEDGAVPLLTCCLSSTVKSGEFYEPEHTSRGPAKLTQLEPISLEADRAALWSASEAAIGEKWEL